MAGSLGLRSVFLRVNCHDLGEVTVLLTCSIGLVGKSEIRTGEKCSQNHYAQSEKNMKKYYIFKSEIVIYNHFIVFYTYIIYLNGSQN